MMNEKHTKKALLSSMVSLVLCFAMLLGTTFAWFTDTATTKVNTIQAGTLDVDLKMEKTNDDGTTTWVTAVGQTLDFVKAAGHENEDILWEPGATYNLPDLRIVNDGTLALKYKVVITGIKGDAKLNEAIDWTITTKKNVANEEITTRNATNEEITTELGADHALAAKDSNTLTISGTMKTSAGNEYQDLSIDGIAITVYAAQDTVESDSNGTDYDEDALYRTIIQTEGKLGTSYKNVNKTLEDYDITHTFNGNESDGMVFYLNKGAELTVNNMNFSTNVKSDTGKRNIGFYLYNGAKLTINSGNFTMDGQWDALIWAQGGKNGERCTVTINGGNFTANGGGNSTIVNAYSGYGYGGSDVYITGGFFDLSKAANPNVTLQWKNNVSTMIVTGGTFVNYNPKDHGVVPEGYTVKTLPQTDGTTWYTVVAE